MDIQIPTTVFQVSVLRLYELRIRQTNLESPLVLVLMRFYCIQKQCWYGIRIILNQSNLKSETELKTF